MKTSRACFANFIHQKDASIAHFIIGMYNKMNLYTVHDNFIVNPTQANHVTHCYTSAFRSLGDPLSHVNLFLINNILLYSTVCNELTSADLTSYVTFLNDMDEPTTTSSSASCARSLLPLLRKARSDELESTNVHFFSIVLSAVC